MSLRDLPQASIAARPQNFSWDAPSDALAKWAELPLAAASEDASTINILDTIGEDPWSAGGGFTSRRASAALRAIGAGNSVTVNVNSYGGDMWEGIAIYNMLAAHQGKVTVNVLGIAASAASIIAMAGDEVAMGEGAQLMIHNAWGLVVGNSHDLRAAADAFDGFNATLASVYHARTGQKLPELHRLMDAESYLSAADAIAMGFADGMMQGGAKAAVRNDIDPGLMAKRRMEAALAKAGHSRADRQQMIAALGAPRDASTDQPAARDAGDLLASLTRLASTIAS